MTTEIPLSSRRPRAFPPRFVSSETLQQLPDRRPADPPAGTSSIQWALVDLDRYEVSIQGRTCGYIDVIGAVFVILSGSRYDRAVEVGQTLIFEDAVLRIQEGKTG